VCGRGATSTTRPDRLEQPLVAVASWYLSEPWPKRSQGRDLFITRSL
jgi:hypothetical protein